MKDDFFKSKVFPKFFMKTEQNEVFALGKTRSSTDDFKVGFKPIHKNHEHDCFYTPAYYEISSPSQNTPSSTQAIHQPVKSHHDCSYDEWALMVEVLKKKIESRELKKGVLKRETTFTFAESLSPENFFLEFQKKNPHVNHFFIQESEDITFFGGTPEFLYSKKNQHLETMALASTIPSHANLDLLLNDSKYLNEFFIVQNQIKELLTPVTKNIQVFDPEAKKFGPLVHLYSKIAAELEELSDLEFIDYLHPTAAIIGYPQKKALEIVSSIESSPRNYYASALGYISNNQSEILVGIRSGIISGNLLRAFTGVGIVEESNALDEWQELDLKLKPIKIWVNQ